MYITLSKREWGLDFENDIIMRTILWLEYGPKMNNKKKMRSTKKILFDIFFIEKNKYNRWLV